jgi:hypothetical protein
VARAADPHEGGDVKRVANDPLRLQRETLQVQYRAILPGGMSIEATTRTFRCSPEQRERFEALITELFEGTPELQGSHAEVAPR